MDGRNFWIVRDNRGLILYYGPQPLEDADGNYTSTHPSIGRLPEGSVNIEPDKPVRVTIKKDEGK